MIYVDKLRNNGWVVHGRTVSNCHLYNDGNIEELIDFAEKIGLKLEWLQKRKDGSFLHYDLTSKKRHEAILAGAKEKEIYQ